MTTRPGAHAPGTLWTTPGPAAVTSPVAGVKSSALQASPDRHWWTLFVCGPASSTAVVPAAHGRPKPAVFVGGVAASAVGVQHSTSNRPRNPVNFVRTKFQTNAAWRSFQPSECCSHAPQRR
jgi:hypothetical protein